MNLFRDAKGVKRVPPVVRFPLDRVFAMMGHLGTPPTKSIKDYLEEKGVPSIFPATLASLWTTSGTWHIGDLVTSVDQTWLIVDYLVGSWRSSTSGRRSPTG